MNHTIIRNSLKLLAVVVTIYSLFMFLRGHNEPGGGFIGGLILTLAFILILISGPNSYLKNFLKEKFFLLVGLSILGLLSVALLPVMIGLDPLSAIWSKIPLPLAGKLSSVLFFDFFILIIVCVCTSRAFIAFSEKSEVEF